jgi:hypothetical protein
VLYFYPMTRPIEQPIIYQNTSIHERLAKSKITGLIIWSSLVILQSIWFWGQQELITTLLILAGGMIGVITFFNSNFLRRYPIATIMMIGYTSYYFLLPPLATLIEGKPVSTNLLHPTLILIHATICLIFFLLAFTVYRKSSVLQKLRWLISRKIYQPAGLFNSPSNVHLLIMGGIGLLSMGYEYFFAGGYQRPPEGTINKFIQGFYPLAYLPYLIMLNKIIGKEESNNRIWISILAIYSILLGIVSLARNSRAALFMGVASIVLAYLYGLATGLYKLSKKTLQKLAIVAIVTIILAGPMADMAISMVVVRSMRTEISASELVTETIKTFQDKAALARYRNDMLGNKSPDWYDWSYVDNLFLDRMSNLKFADINLDIALTIGRNARSYLQEIEIQKILAIFPQPIVNVFNLPVDKNLVTKASSGDFMLYAATGNKYTLGGFRTGSLLANGFVLFDWGYPLILGAILLVLFPLADSITTKKTIKEPSTNIEKRIHLLSPMVVVGLFTWLFFLTSAATGAESISSLANYILRGWIQAGFIYGCGYWISYFPMKMLSKTKL